MLVDVLLSTHKLLSEPMSWSLGNLTIAYNSCTEHISIDDESTEVQKAVSSDRCVTQENSVRNAGSYVS